MVDEVKPDRRGARRADTEARLVTAASERFVAHGYSATTLADVAEDAGLAPRTLYLHFATKAELLRRCIGVAIVGDTEDVPLADRSWMAAAQSAPTLDERLRRMAAVTAQLMARTGPLLEVAQQAAGVEPEIAAAAQAGREDTRRTLLEFWQRAAADGLLPRGAALGWLSETAAVLAQADTYLLLRATAGWDIATYEHWLVESWRRLAASSGSS